MSIGVPGAADIIAIKKTTDETVTSSTVIQDDNELVLPVGANEIWEIDFFMLGWADDTADFKYGFAIPALGDLLFSKFSSTINSEGEPDNSIIGPTVVTVGGAARYISFHWTLTYLGAANAGEVQFQWAQNTSQAFATKVLAGSCMKAVRVYP